MGDRWTFSQPERDSWGLMAGAVVLKTHVLYHCQLVRNKARLRQMLKIAEWISEIAPREQDPQRLVAEAVERLEAVAQ
jgi:flagellar biosynthesis component FlhA